MDVTKITMSKEEAEVAYKEYLEVVKVRKEKQYEDLKKVYRAISKGYKVIDIFDAFKRTSSENNQPKLAIVRADSRQAFFQKELGGAGVFSDGNLSDWNRQEKVSDVRLPGETFSEWEMEDEARGRANWNIKERNIVTNVPLIPGHLLPEGKLENYYILFEVEEWNSVATTVDPYLLKRINANTFIVLAEWDVTDVEAVVMRGV